MDPNHDRMVQVSSGAHRLHPEEIDYELLAQEHQSSAGGEEFDQWHANGRSKLANILFSNTLARRIVDSGSKITSNALHPGNVQTAPWSKIGRNNESGISVEEGALTSIYLATSKNVQGQSGGYFVLCERVTKIYNDEEAKGLDYLGKSKLRSEVSMSETEGKALWAEASKSFGLGVDLL
jgi:NAD(P)-dependent dehydrogenase (short-subunit alcohol dehydrogenase family)